MRTVRPSVAFAIVIGVALLAAAIPFAVVLAHLEWGTERYVPVMLAVVTAFFLLFPLGLRFLTPRPERVERPG